MSCDIKNLIMPPKLEGYIAFGYFVHLSNSPFVRHTFHHRDMISNFICGIMIENKMTRNLYVSRKTSSFSYAPFSTDIMNSFLQDISKII